jgi:ABC-type glycerol-3-phosphate transport system substrate-binding protein
MAASAVKGAVSTTSPYRRCPPRTEGRAHTAGSELNSPAAQTIDGDVHTGTYRKDLFGDPAEKEAFKAKYGYDLAPPETWKQYYDIAEFFTRPDKNLWGTAEAFVRGGQQFWFFFSHAAA